MQKSERGLMRSAKQQKRKQKLFALYNNNLINCLRQVLKSPIVSAFYPLSLGTMCGSWGGLNPTTAVAVVHD